MSATSPEVNRGDVAGDCVPGGEGCVGACVIEGSQGVDGLGGQSQARGLRDNLHPEGPLAGLGLGEGLGLRVDAVDGQVSRSGDARDLPGLVDLPRTTAGDCR
jgi:hypothetical protein